MAFGISRNELNEWKQSISKGEIAFLTHYWHDKRFPHYHAVTKVGCLSKAKLIEWGEKYHLSPEWIHEGKYPHFDLMGEKQIYILQNEGLIDHIIKFKLQNVILPK